MIIQKTRTARQDIGSSFAGKQLSFTKLNNGRLIIGGAIILEGVVGTAVNSLTPDGAARLLENINITGDIAGKQINPYVNLNGAQIVQFGQIDDLQSPRTVNAALGTGLVHVEIPFSFVNPYFDGDLQYCTCIPTWDSSDFNIEARVAQGASVDVGTNALAFSSLNAYVRIDSISKTQLPARMRNSSWYMDSVFAVKSNPAIVTGTNELEAVPAGGKVSGIMLSGWASATTKQVDTTAKASSTPFDTSDGAFIKILGMDEFQIENTSFLDARDENYRNVIDGLVDGNVLFPYNKGRSRLLPTDYLKEQKRDLQISASCRAGTGVKIDMVYRKIIDGGRLDLEYDKV